MDLRLFTVEIETNRIFFPSAHLHQGFDYNERQYDKYVDKDLTIEIHADVGKPPPKLTKNIKDILDEAVVEGVE